MSSYKVPMFYWLTAIIGLVVALLLEGWGDALGLFLIMLPLVPVARSLTQGR